MEKIPRDDLQKLLENVLDAAKCPICFIFLQPPVSQCVNGHGICSSCRTKINHCPSCKECFVISKSILLQQLLELFPHDCKFTGCPEFIRPPYDHEKWCGFASTKCKRCDWNGCRKDIGRHINTDHPDIRMLKEMSEDVALTNLIPDRSCTGHVPILAHGNFFWLDIQLNPNEKLLSKTFHLVPNGKIDCNFTMKFVLENSTNKYVGCTVLTADSVLNPDHNGNSISLHSSIIHQFFNNKKELVYSFYVIKE